MPTSGLVCPVGGSAGPERRSASISAGRPLVSRVLPAGGRAAAGDRAGLARRSLAETASPGEAIPRRAAPDAVIFPAGAAQAPKSTPRTRAARKGDACTAQRSTRARSAHAGDAFAEAGMSVVLVFVGRCRAPGRRRRAGDDDEGDEEASETPGSLAKHRSVFRRRVDGVPDTKEGG